MTRQPKNRRPWQSLAEHDAAPRVFVPGVPDAATPSTTRREFLQLVSASMAAAGLAGCGQRRPEAIVPYVRMPESVVPGQPRHYASTLSLAGIGRGVVVETHEGRPTRIDGNPHHPGSLGTADIFAQAAVLDLYDARRARAPTNADGIASYGALATALADARGGWSKTGGAGLAVLTEPDGSPSFHAALTALRSRWPAIQWYQHDTLLPGNRREATRRLFGQAADAVCRLDHARVVASFDCDILGAGPAQAAMARQYATTRDPQAGGEGFSRWYAVESTPALTGAAADHRLGLPATEIAAGLEQLAAALGVLDGAVEGPLPGHWLRALAGDLRAAGRAALVLVGDHLPVRAHALGILINERLQAPGNTLAYIDPVVPSPDRGLAALAAGIDAGRVTSLLMLCHDPIATAPGDLPLAGLLQRLDFCVHHAPYTGKRSPGDAFWHVPQLHELEAWGDGRAFDGTASLVQPAITPLFSGMTRSELLRLAAGEAAPSGYDIVRGYWRERGGPDFEASWRESLASGLVRDSAAEPLEMRPDPRALPRRDRHSRTGGLSLRLTRDETLWDGRYVRNPWLQELPRPLAKTVWGHCALLAPATAERLGIVSHQRLRITTRAGSVEVSAFVLPGHAAEQLSLSLCTVPEHEEPPGGGAEHFTADVVDSYRLRTGEDLVITEVEVVPLSVHRAVITTQTHHSLHTDDVIREAVLEDYLADPDLLHDEPAERPPEHSLYPPPPEGDYAWAMTIDLNTCIGCNACTLACQSENNIPVVGPAEARRGRVMHWIRVDRYYRDEPQAPRTRFQPVPCMHCEYAPCELVCPTAATLHDDEGLNVMVYNRCIGTRDCSQNCPYKVRRFNWLEYNPYGRDVPLSAARFNPDVTVRSEGVMEKCTYCIQRISRARREAKSENRPIGADEVVTACQSACPTRAITFGDMKNPDARVSGLKKSPRRYDLLGELNTRPRTSYLARLVNPHPDLEE